MGKIISNGKQYSGGSALHDYSSDEQLVGFWFDKPRYEKTFDIGNLPNSTTKLVPHNISDIDKIVSITGFCDNGNGLYFGLPTVSSSHIAIYVDGANINIQTTSDRTEFSGFVTLQYTKSTD